MTGKRRFVAVFLCTGNSCRSQMAEGWARALLGDEVSVHSAGTEAHGLNPRAVRVMEEAGVDISGHASKTVEDLDCDAPDLAVTVCDSAAEACPVPRGAARVVHHSFDDPASARGTEEEVLRVFRRVRDEIRDFVRTLPAMLEEKGSAS